MLPANRCRGNPHNIIHHSPYTPHVLINFCETQPLAFFFSHFDSSIPIQGNVCLQQSAEMLQCYSQCITPPLLLLFLNCFLFILMLSSHLLFPEQMRVHVLQDRQLMPLDSQASHGCAREFRQGLWFEGHPSMEGREGVECQLVGG